MWNTGFVYLCVCGAASLVSPETTITAGARAALVIAAGRTRLYEATGSHNGTESCMGHASDVVYIWPTPRALVLEECNGIWFWFDAQRPSPCDAIQSRRVMSRPTQYLIDFVGTVLESSWTKWSLHTETILACGRWCTLISVILIIYTRYTQVSLSIKHICISEVHRICPE